MLDEKYLVHGLNALSRAHKMNYFEDGHRGGAIISAYYLCRENDVEEGVSDIITSMIDKHWAQTELCEPFPKENSDPGLQQQVVESMNKNIGKLRQVGHNVILPTLALKAFQDLPETITPSRVEGICKLADSFQVTEFPIEDINDIPDLSNPIEATEFVLNEFLKSIERVKGYGQGWAGHLLTYSRAHIIDLQKLGYADFAKMDKEAFRMFIGRIRMEPNERSIPIVDHLPSELFPLQKAYWEQNMNDSSLGLGHIFKYPSAFYGLMNLAKNSDLKKQCLASAYNIF